MVERVASVWALIGHSDDRLFSGRPPWPASASSFQQAIGTAVRSNRRTLLCSRSRAFSTATTSTSAIGSRSMAMPGSREALSSPSKYAQTLSRTMRADRRGSSCDAEVHRVLPHLARERARQDGKAHRRRGGRGLLPECDEREFGDWDVEWGGSLPIPRGVALGATSGRSKPGSRSTTAPVHASSARLCGDGPGQRPPRSRRRRAASSWCPR